MCGAEKVPAERLAAGGSGAFVSQLHFQSVDKMFPSPWLSSHVNAFLCVCMCVCV